MISLQHEPKTTHPVRTGVILMTYGSATTAEYVEPFFKSIYGERVSPETIAEFERRYREIGLSPLIEITKTQATLLESRLGENFIVRSGMKHGRPSIAEAINECKGLDATRITGIILSPQYSAHIMNGYDNAFKDACAGNGYLEKAVSLAKPWPAETHFIQFLSRSILASLQKLGENTPVIFTTHSMPKRVIDNDPQYLSQLQTTINAVLHELPRTITWYAGYQSAGHSPEPWLKPDLVDILENLKHKAHSKVLIAPIQFLADHLEVLYDLDIAAKQHCEEFGIEYYRIQLPNIDPLFIETLAKIARNS